MTHLKVGKRLVRFTEEKYGKWALEKTLNIVSHKSVNWNHAGMPLQIH